MTAQEREARSAAKKLADAIVAIEMYDGDPEDVIDDAKGFLIDKLSPKKYAEAKDLLKKIQEFFSETEFENESYRAGGRRDGK